jgi:hypothetical protein
MGSGTRHPAATTETGAYRLPAVDRNRARATIRSGLVTASIALFIFGLAFYVTILYIA